METAIVAKSNNALTVVPEGAWGAEDVDAKDILIPKMLLMQGLSKLVTEEKVRQGEIVNSVTGRVVGGRDKTTEIVPILTYKFWRYSLKGPKDSKFNFDKIEPYTLQNADQAWEEVLADGSTVRRDACIGFYVLDVVDIGNPGTLPYLIAFARSSYREGRKLSTHFSQSAMTRTAPASMVFKLSCHKDSKDGNDYWVFDIAESRASKPEEIAVAYNWYKQLKTGAHVVDQSDEEEVTKVAQPTTVSQKDVF